MDKNKLLKYKIGANLSGVGSLSKIFAIQSFSACDCEITPEQFSVLSVLYENDGLYQRQLSALTLKDRPNISRILSILESMGYITKTPDVSSRKIYKISITPKGIEVYEKILPVVLKVWLETVEGISDSDIDAFNNVLVKIKQNLLSKINIQM
ncbi:MarR family transcriptional regulator [bacterium]|nr:MarR family transcriptional regulator [bacterium]